jgi:hypothetical protein
MGVSVCSVYAVRRVSLGSISLGRSSSSSLSLFAGPYLPPKPDRWAVQCSPNHNNRTVIRSFLFAVELRVPALRRATNELLPTP